MVKVSANRFVSNRVTAIRNEIKTGTQRLRNRTLAILKENFKGTANVARGEIGHQRAQAAPFFGLCKSLLSGGQTGL